MYYTTTIPRTTPVNQPYCLRPSRLPMPQNGPSEFISVGVLDLSTTGRGRYLASYKRAPVSPLSVLDTLLVQERLWLCCSQLTLTNTHTNINTMVVPTIQKPAPAFKKTAVVNGTFEEVSLEQYKGKWVLLAFFPMAFTFVCPTEIIAYSEKAKEFKEKGAEILFASTDSEYSLLAWTNVARADGGLGPLNIPLIADRNHSLAKDYGVLVEDEGITFRGIFLIDPKGVLRQITINDLPVGRSVDESLRLLEAFQFTDKYGEVCPANWTPGADTIVPEPENSKKYFSKHG